MEEASNDSNESVGSTLRNVLIVVLLVGVFTAGGFFAFLDLSSVFFETLRGEVIARAVLFLLSMSVIWLSSRSSSDTRIPFLSMPFLALLVYGFCVGIQIVGDWCLTGLFALISKTWATVSDLFADAGNYFGAVLSRNSQVLIVGLAVIVSLMVYFSPAITAVRRKKRNALAIFVLNLFLGWTLLGWALAFVWACTHDD